MFIIRGCQQLPEENMTDSKAIVVPAQAGWMMRKLQKAVNLLLKVPLEITAKEEALGEYGLIDQVRRYYEHIRWYVKLSVSNPSKYTCVHTYYNCKFEEHELGMFYCEIINSDKTSNRKSLEDILVRLNARAAELEKLIP